MNKNSVAIRHVSRVCAVKSAIWAKLLSYTVEDIYNLPEGVRAELIDGEMYMVAALGTEHQRLVQIQDRN